MSDADPATTLLGRRFVDVTGDDHARGLAQGQRFRQRLPGMARSLARLPLGLHGLPFRLRQRLIFGALAPLGHVYLPLHRPLLRRHAAGRYGRVLEGLAQGLGISAAHLYGFHAFEIESGIVGFRLGCTALAFDPSLTDTAAPKLAYNHDFPLPFRRHLVIRRSCPTQGARLRSLCLTYEILVGAIAGLNEAGLAATLNQAFTRRGQRLRPTLLSSLVLQDCLDHCAQVPEAVERSLALPVAAGALLTLVDAAGRRAVVELAPWGSAVRRGTPGKILATFNKYLCDETVAQEIPVGALGTGLADGYDLHEANVVRQRRFDQLTEHADGPWSDRQIHRLLSDHAGPKGPNTLCRHDPRLGGDTIVSAILDPQARTLRVLWGWPCQGSYAPPILLR